MTEIACRVCGVATDLNLETTQGRTPIGQWDPAGDLTVGTCQTCQALDTETPGLAIRACLRLIKRPEADWSAFGAILADMEIDPAAVLYSVSGSPRKPQSKAFAHVPKDVRDVLKHAYARLLVDRVEATLPQPALEPISPPADAPQGCLACGVATAMAWHGALHTFGMTVGPDPVDGYVCPACAAALEAVGAVGQRFIERAVMQAKNLDFTPRVRAWVATGLPPQAEAWGWMGDLLEPPEVLDPITFLMEQVADLANTVEALRSEVEALRPVTV